MATTVDFVHAYAAVNNSGLSILLFFSIKDTIWTNLFSIVIPVKEIHLYKFPFLNIFS